MHAKTVAKCLLIASVAAFLSGCLTRRTVIREGRVVESNYVFTRPFKNTINNSR